jgi:hypothetical protein
MVQFKFVVVHMLWIGFNVADLPLLLHTAIEPLLPAHSIRSMTITPKIERSAGAFTIFVPARCLLHPGFNEQNAAGEDNS